MVKTVCVQEHNASPKKCSQKPLRSLTETSLHILNTAYDTLEFKMGKQIHQATSKCHAQKSWLKMMSTIVEASGTRIKDGSTATRAKGPNLQVLTPITCNHNSRKSCVYASSWWVWGGGGGGGMTAWCPCAPFQRSIWRLQLQLRHTRGMTNRQF